MNNFSIVHWIIVGVIIFGFYKIFAGKGGKDMFCKSCGHSGPSKNHTPGSLLIEIVLWICFIVPGLVYSLWRLSAKKAACSACGSLDLVPPNSPIAIATKKQLGI